jgi:hypothetical protein
VIILHFKSLTVIEYVYSSLGVFVEATQADEGRDWHSGTFPLQSHRLPLHTPDHPHQPEEVLASAINQFGRLIADSPRSFFAWDASIDE